MKRTLLAMLMILVVTTGILAQRGPRPMGTPPMGTSTNATQRPNPMSALKEALALTDAQVEAIRALMETRRQRAETIFTEIQQNRQALDALLNAASPNATAVGNAAIAVHASHQKLAAERDWFLTELKKLLTGDQQQKLDALIAARSQLLGPLGVGGGPDGPGGRGGRGGFGPGRGHHPQQQ